MSAEPAASERKRQAYLLWFLAGALWLIFAGLWTALYRHPLASPLLFAAFPPLGLLLFWVHEALHAEWGIAFALGALAATLPIPLGHWGQLAWTDLLPVFADLGLALVLLSTGQGFFDRLAQAVYDCRRQIGDAAGAIKNAAQQNNFYFKRIAHLRSQIWTRQGLYSFSREVGTLLDPEAIKQKLLGKVQGLFPNERVTLQTSAQSNDPIERWVAEKKSSFLIKDTSDPKAVSLISNLLQEDVNLPESRCVMAVPLIIGRNLIGLVRVDSDSTNRFQEVDMQQLELYAHLSTLALENALLFEKVNALATRDGLTGLATHRVFQDRLNEELQRAARYRTPLSLVMLDIDHFKNVNDTYGHLAGDQVLKAAAETLRAHCRNVDFAARYGGEEFCLIFPETPLDQAYHLAEALRKKVAQRRIEAAQTLVSITVSIGCAAFPQDAQTPNQLLRKADERLYLAKQGGRNRTVMESA